MAANERRWILARVLSAARLRNKWPPAIVIDCLCGRSECHCAIRLEGDAAPDDTRPRPTCLRTKAARAPLLRVVSGRSFVTPRNPALPVVSIGNELVWTSKALRRTKETDDLYLDRGGTIRHLFFAAAARAAPCWRQGHLLPVAPVWTARWSVAEVGSNDLFVTARPQLCLRRLREPTLAGAPSRVRRRNLGSSIRNERRLRSVFSICRQFIQLVGATFFASGSRLPTAGGSVCVYEAACCTQSRTGVPPEPVGPLYGQSRRLPAPFPAGCTASACVCWRRCHSRSCQFRAQQASLLLRLEVGPSRSDREPARETHVASSLPLNQHRGLLWAVISMLVRWSRSASSLNVCRWCWCTLQVAKTFNLLLPGFFFFFFIDLSSYSSPAAHKKSFVWAPLRALLRRTGEQAHPVRARSNNQSEQAARDAEHLPLLADHHDERAAAAGSNAHLPPLSAGCSRRPASCRQLAHVARAP